VVRFFYNPNGAYRPKELEHNEMFPGVHATPGHCQEKRKVIGGYSELAAILRNEPIKLHAEGTKVLTTLSRREDHPHYVPEKALRHWAMYKRPDNMQLPGGLRTIQTETLSAGVLLYAMTVYDETTTMRSPVAILEGAAQAQAMGVMVATGDPRRGKSLRRGRRKWLAAKRTFLRRDQKGQRERPNKEQARARAGPRQRS
jgi:hypothetical protein